MSLINQRLTHTKQRITEACLANQRTESEVTLVAVSKRHSADAIQQAYDNGQRHFGENYLQEALEKIESLAIPDLAWHFIGAIQSNKTRAIAENFQWVHTVERLKVAQRLSSQRPTNLPPLNVCIQINIDNEQSKSGILEDDVAELALAIEKLPNLQLRGLMAIPDKTKNGEAFERMQELFSRLQNSEAFRYFDTLSMGMSNDLEEAIKSGATMVRIGTDIFGARTQ